MKRISRPSIYEAMGHRCYWLAGALDRPPKRSMLVPEAHFQSVLNRWINERVWGQNRRSPQASTAIHHRRAMLKTYLNQVIDAFRIDILIIQNALAIPMNIPRSWHLQKSSPNGPCRPFCIITTSIGNANAIGLRAIIFHIDRYNPN